MVLKGDELAKSRPSSSAGLPSAVRVVFTDCRKKPEGLQLRLLDGGTAAATGAGGSSSSSSVFDLRFGPIPDGVAVEPMEEESPRDRGKCELKFHGDAGWRLLGGAGAELQYIDFYR